MSLGRVVATLKGGFASFFFKGKGGKGRVFKGQMLFVRFLWKMGREV